MNNSKTYQILTQLSTQEAERMGLFIKSPFFNREKKVTALYKYLISEPSNKITKKEIYKALYPNEVYKDSRIRYLSSTLYTKIKEFIIIEETLLENKSNNFSFLSYLRKRRLSSLYAKEEQLLKKEHSKKQPQKSQDYHNLYLFELERMNFYAEKKRTETVYLKEMHNNLDAYYLTEKLKIACTSINQQKLYKTNQQEKLFESLISYIENNLNLEEIPLLQVYYNAYKMLVEGGRRYYEDLKVHFIQNELKIIEVRDAFLLAINYCIQQLNKGQSEYQKEIFELYQLGIENEVILNQGKLSGITYSNVVTIGIRLKQFKTVEDFIEKKQVLLEEKSKYALYSFNKAKLHFERKEYHAVTKIYSEKFISEVLLNIQMRILQIKAFYELGEKELCGSQLLSLDQLLNRKTVLAYHKVVFKNVIKVFNQLLKLNFHDRDNKSILLSYINGLKPITEKDWFIEKVNEK